MVIFLDILLFYVFNPSRSKFLSLKRIEFSQGTATSREEWFIRGAEPNSKDQSKGQLNQRILYPPSGTVIALDPDIPTELQKVFFILQTNEAGVRWKLNGVPMAMVGKTISWTPKVGKYSLAIADKEGKLLDYVYFEVRGLEADRNILPEDEKGDFTN